MSPHFGEKTFGESYDTGLHVNAHIHHDAFHLLIQIHFGQKEIGDTSQGFFWPFCKPINRTAIDLRERENKRVRWKMRWCVEQ